MECQSRDTVFNKKQKFYLFHVCTEKKFWQFFYCKIHEIHSNLLVLDPKTLSDQLKFI